MSVFLYKKLSANLPVFKYKGKKSFNGKYPVFLKLDNFGSIQQHFHSKGVFPIVAWDYLHFIN